MPVKRGRPDALIPRRPETQGHMPQAWIPGFRGDDGLTRAQDLPSLPPLRYMVAMAAPGGAVSWCL
jgi:hypothetical protein